MALDVSDEVGEKDEEDAGDTDVFECRKNLEAAVCCCRRWRACICLASEKDFSQQDIVSLSEHVKLGWGLLNK
jgi:hypothetical protein